VAKLYYAHDPMCSYCYAFRNTWSELKRQLPENIKVINLVGGLAPDTNEPMPDEMRTKLINTWHKINQRFGVEFNFDFWQKNTPRRSTYPACRAVLAAKEFEKELPMIEAIQNAYYLKAQNPSDIETLSQCALDIGIKVIEFNKKIKSQKINSSLLLEIKESQRLGLNSFPSLLLEYRNKRTKISIDYRSSKPMLKMINLLMVV